MSGLVIDLQEKAIDNNTDVSTLLRTAFLVAKKLDLKDSEEWILKELRGYKKEDEVPNYRKVRGMIGYQFFINGQWELADINKEFIEDNSLNKKWLKSSISHLENSLKGASSSLYFSFDEPDNSKIKKRDVSLGGIGESLHSLKINGTAVKNIFDEVRNKILNWAIELEKLGITGSGMSFSTQEKENSKDFHWVIQNIFNGEVSNSQIQQGTLDSLQSLTNNELTFELNKLIDVVDSHKDDLSLSNDKYKSIEEAVEILREEKEKDVPNRSKISNTISVIKQIAIGAGGGVSSNLILEALSNMPI